MTYPHLFGYVLVAAIVWWLFFEIKKEPIADVELGEPTVSGSGSEQLGGTDYLTSGSAYSEDEVP